MKRVVTYVKPLEGFRLLLVFDGFEERVLDFARAYGNKGKMFQQVLKDEKLFRTVKLDGTGTICWKNGLDIAVESLLAHSVATRGVGGVH